MIRGEVNVVNEIIVPLPIYDANQQIFLLDAVIDTGFSGHLTLPPETVVALGLSFQQRQSFLLGDNSEIEFEVYLAAVVWDGEERDIAVLSSDGGALIGMQMLRGFHLFADVVDGGEVRIEKRS